MTEKRGNCKVEIGFSEWIGLVCKHEPLAYLRLLSVGLLMIAASFLMMHSAIVGFLLFVGLGGAFMWAFHRAWRRALKDPPWYLKEALKCRS